MTGPKPFAVGQLDHVHVLVRDRVAAAAWYARVLGLVKTKDYPAMGDPGGPVVLMTEDGVTHLALFQAPAEPPSPDVKTVALKVGGVGFLDFLGRLPELALAAAGGAPVTASDVVDHGHAWSLYFSDPDGNTYELITYDHARVAPALAAMGRPG